MGIPWYDVLLALILVGCAIVLGLIGTELSRRRRVRDFKTTRLEQLAVWRRDWLVGQPLDVEAEKRFQVVWIRPELENGWTDAPPRRIEPETSTIFVIPDGFTVSA